MSKERLHRFKTITTWGGVATTFCGIVLSYATGGSLAAGGLSAFGLLLTCGGYWISGAIAKHQEAERAADQEKLDEFESVSDFLNKAGVFDRPHTLKRMISYYESNYDVEHQDDGR